MAGQVIPRYIRHWAPRVEFSPDGELVVVWSPDSHQPPSLGVFWCATGGLVLSGWRARVQGAAFSPDGRRVALSNEGGLELHGLAGEPVVHRLLRRWSRSSAWQWPHFFPDGDRLVVFASVAEEGSVQVLESARLDTVRSLSWPDAAGTVHSVSFPPGGRSLVAVVGLDRHDRPDHAISWDLETGRGVTHPSPSAAAELVALSPDGCHFARPVAPGRMHLWRRPTLSEPWQEPVDLTVPISALRGLRFSPDSRFLVAHGELKEDEQVSTLACLWQTEGGPHPAVLPLPGQPVDVQFHPHSLLATLCTQPEPRAPLELTLWGLTSGRPVARAPSGQDQVRRTPTLRFSPDGRWLAIPYLEGVELWELAQLLG